MEAARDLSPHLQEARRVIDLEIKELSALRERLDGQFDRAIEVLVTCMARRGKVVVIGVGKSGQIGGKIAATLTSTGCPAVVLDSLNALHGDLGVVCDGDVCVALSYSGETEELVRVLPHLRTFAVEVIGITGRPESLLARHSDVVLSVAVEREACPLELAPTSSTTAMLVLGDALAMALLKARGFQRSDFARLHPGGTLGRELLTKTTDIMRPLAQTPIVTEDATVGHGLEAMTRQRAGVAVVVSKANGKLAGVFSQGDFVRAYLRDPQIKDRCIAELMTRHPVTIAAESLAGEVVRVLKEKKIDDLIVIDDNHVPVGLVDSQDLARLRLI